jgi:hypothetical protein
MYHEIILKKTEVVSISKDDMATVAVHLNYQPNNDFAEWFQNPTGATSTTMSVPQMCNVEGMKIVFQTPKWNVEKTLSLVNEWISKANAFASAKQAGRDAEKSREREQKEELEKERQRLQSKIDDNK